MFRNVIFDLDGTLVDSWGDIVDCLRSAYSQCGLTLGDGDVGRQMIGPPLADMVRGISPGLGDAGIASVVAAYRSCYDNSPLARTVLYPGVAELLEALVREGRRLFIVTNKPSLATRRILEKFALNLFSDVVAPDQGAHGNLSKTQMVADLVARLHLETAHTVMVGDAASDIRAAHANRIKAAAVLHGYGDRDELIAAGPDYIFDDIPALKSLLF